jgi:hypothetical protein
MSLILNGTDGLSDVDGTAATPAIRGTDANTGIFFPAADTIAFSEGGAEVARFDANGRLGVGTTSPAFNFQCVNTAGNSFISAVSSNSTTAGILLGDTDSATVGRVEYNNADNAMLLFANGSERMRIDSAGRALFGTTTTSIAGSGAFITPADGRITLSTGGGGQYASFLNVSGTQIGFIQNSGNSSTTYSTSSDYRLKDNVAPMTGALEQVQALKPVTYKWKSTGETSQGFIAHELAEVCPDAVVGEKDAVDSEGKPVYQGIDTSFLVATLTAAIQELKAELDSVKAELAALKA